MTDRWASKTIRALVFAWYLEASDGHFTRYFLSLSSTFSAHILLLKPFVLFLCVCVCFSDSIATSSITKSKRCSLPLQHNDSVATGLQKLIAKKIGIKKRNKCWCDWIVLRIMILKNWFDVLILCVFCTNFGKYDSCTVRWACRLLLLFWRYSHLQALDRELFSSMLRGQIFCFFWYWINLGALPFFIFFSLELLVVLMNFYVMENYYQSKYCYLNVYCTVQSTWKKGKPHPHFSAFWLTAQPRLVDHLWLPT